MKDKKETQYVVEVIPLVRGLPKDSLTYFSADKPAVGTFVNIKIRNAETFGLVTRVIPAREAKAELKQSAFALKKLSGPSQDFFLSKAFIEASRYLSDYYAVPMGNILGALIPKMLLESPELLGIKESNENIEPFTSEPLLIQLPDEERYREYKSVVRGAFAQNKSVIFITPTQEDALRASYILSQGIKEYVYTTARQSPKALGQILLRAKEESHPILFITTPSYIAFNRPDFQTIIVEKENSKLYRTVSRPHVDFRIFLERYASRSARKIIFGDSILSLSSLHKEKLGSYAEMSPLKWKMPPEAKTSLVDMKPNRSESRETGKAFEILSPEMNKMIQNAIHEKRKVFLFGARKGLFPSTVCRDCGHILPCPNCGAPIVLHENTQRGRHYLCHACGATRNAETRCDHCESWNLTPLGIGIDRIGEAVRELFPDVPIYIMDKDHTHTAKRAAEKAQKFASEKGGILIGTELALLYLEKVPYSGIISLDSLFSIPDFGIHERIFYLVGRILEKTECMSVVQTRNIGKNILTQAVKGDILDFYRTEISERKELNYPPFSLFIKITTEGSEKELQEKAKFLNQEFRSYLPDFMKERGLKTGKIALSMILRVSRKTWPDRDLTEKLFLLTGDFLIKVDPESIL